MIENTVRYIYSFLLAKKYEELEHLTGSKNLSAAYMMECIDEYGCHLMPYPESINLDVVEISKSSPKEWSVVAPIYTIEEGMSDLSLELTIIDNNEDIFQTEVDNIHVR